MNPLQKLHIFYRQILCLLCELIAQNFVSISFLIARNLERSGSLVPNFQGRFGEIMF